MNARRVIFSTLTVLWMLVIFFFSSANGDKSKEYSTGFGKTICRTFVPDFDKLSMDEQKVLIEKINYPIRKLAHFTEFAILGLFLAGALVKEMGVFDKKRLFISFLLGVVYSLTDEFHQIFVDDRSGKILDVFIDSLGVFLSVSAFALMQKSVFVQKINHRES